MKNRLVTTLKDQVYEAMFTDIIKGVYSADMILTEKFFIEKYQVSRAPIREALLQLTSKKFLISIPRQGYRILQPDKSYMIELAKFRAVTEPAFLERYFSSIDTDCLETLRIICDKYAACPDHDFMAHWKYNCEFHLKLFSMYKNPYAYEALENALYLQTVYFVQTEHDATMDLHRAIVDYIEKRDVNTAMKILRADIETLTTSDSL
ncbi:MAG: GntR family transcriptional regulator [Sporomusaceae bacterium]|nr:GntR family transcriptional regulator [Sporomusaceae bacterium]